MSGNEFSSQHTRSGRRTGIATKILLAETLALITGLVIVGGAALYLEKQALVGLQRENNLIFVKVMGDEIKNAMLANDIKKVDAYFKDVIERKLAIALSIYNDKGEERGSDSKGDTLVAEVLKSNKPVSSEGILNGTHILETILPLPNEERCQSCHDKETKILGALKLKTSIEQGYAASRKATFWLLISGAVPLAAGFVCLMIVLRLTVTRKINDFVAKLEMLANTDVLTGIANRGYVMIRGEEEFSRAVRNRGRDPQSSALCCIMLDIDYFKQVNDTWGHLAGDQVLREVALRLRQCVRPYDIIGRYGGEEFVALMPDTMIDQGLVVAERIRAGIHDEPICIGADEDGVRISVSLGVSCIHENDRELDDLLKRADEGLYKAKDGGRDRVEWIYSSLVAEVIPIPNQG